MHTLTYRRQVEDLQVVGATTAVNKSAEKQNPGKEPGLHPRSQARPGPARRQSRLGRHKTPPTRSTGTIVALFEHDVTGRTRAPVAKPMGGNRPTNVATLRRAFTIPGSGVQLHRNAQGGTSTGKRCSYMNRPRIRPRYIGLVGYSSRPRNGAYLW